MKKCTVCKNEFPVTSEYFHKDRSRKDGFCDCCKECNKDKVNKYRLEHLDEIRAKKKRYAEEHPEHVKELKHAEYVRHQARYLARSKQQRAEQDPDENRTYKREWAQKDREANPERSREKSRIWREKNPEQAAETARLSREKHRPRILIRDRAKYHANPGEAAVRYHKRRAEKLGLPADFTLADWQYALQYWHYACAICGRQDGLFLLVVGMDHFIPFAAPESPGHVPGNILPLCHGLESCNSSKGHKDPVVWLTARLAPRKAQRKLAEIHAFFLTVRTLDAGLLDAGD